MKKKWKSLCANYVFCLPVFLLVLSIINPQDAYSITASGEIKTDTTWSGIVTVMGDVIVHPEVTLSIQPGTIVKFNRDGNSRCVLTIQGTLSALGSEDQPIVFTSLFDDTEGGDTNGDGEATLPSALNNHDDWRGVVFSDSSNDEHCILQFCKLKYGGKWDYFGDQLDGLINCESASPRILDCQFENSRGFGVRCLTNSNPTISHCSFKNLALDGIYCTGISSPAINNNTFNTCRVALHKEPDACPTFSDNAIETGVMKGIGLSGASLNSDLKQESFGGIDNIPYIVFNDLTIEGTMSIQPGAIVKFNRDGERRYVLAVKGTLSAIGTEIQPIVFTSLFDDTEGGDTNGDGANTLPSVLNNRDDWRGVVFSDSSKDAQCILQFCKLKYGGKWNNWGDQYDGLINCESASPQILDCQFENSWGFGIRCTTNSNPLISRCSFNNLALDGIYCTGISSPAINNNIFSTCRVALHKEPDALPTYNENAVKTGTLKGIGLSGSCLNTDLQQENFGGVNNIPYIVLGDITVNGNMNVHPGVIVKFNRDGDRRYVLTIKGTLSAIGTEAQNIIFTSLFDDTEGGDTNGDGANTLPSVFLNRDDWRGVVFSDSSNDGQCILQFCKLKYGGKWNNWGDQFDGLINCESASPQILDCQFESSLGFGVRCITNSNPIISRCSFNNLAFDGIYCTGISSPAINQNTFSSCRVALHKEPDALPTYNENVIKTGVLKGIGLSGFCLNTVLKQESFGGINNIPYIVLGDITVNGNMIIHPGVIIKFNRDGDSRYVLAIKEMLSAIGTEAQPIVFTSLFDDTEGGDTNGDGANTIPSVLNNRDDWRGVVFSDSSKDDQCILQFCKLKYGGKWNNWGDQYDGLIHCESASPQIINCLLENNRSYGICCLNDSNPTIACCKFSNIEKEWIYVTGTSNPIITENCDHPPIATPTVTPKPQPPEATPTPISENKPEILATYPFDRSALAENGWSEIPGGFTGANPGDLTFGAFPEDCIPSSEDQTGVTITVDAGEVTFIHLSQAIPSGDAPILIRARLRASGSSASLSLGSLKGDFSTGADVDGTISLLTLSSIADLVNEEKVIYTIYNPGEQRSLTPFIQAAGIQNQTTIWLDKIEIVKFDNAQILGDMQ